MSAVLLMQGTDADLPYLIRPAFLLKKKKSNNTEDSRANGANEVTNTTLEAR